MKAYSIGFLPRATILHLELELLALFVSHACDSGAEKEESYPAEKATSVEKQFRRENKSRSPTFPIGRDKFTSSHPLAHSLGRCVLLVFTVAPVVLLLRRPALDATAAHDGAINPAGEGDGGCSPAPRHGTPGIAFPDPLRKLPLPSIISQGVPP